MNIRYPIYEGVYRILTIVHGTIRFLLALFPFCPPCGPHVNQIPPDEGNPPKAGIKTKVKLKIQNV